MYKIAVCDDNEILCLEIKKELLELLNEIELKIDVFFSGEDLENNLINGLEYDLLILDIELGLLGGIEIGKIIREKLDNNIIQIIYISAKKSYAMELFEIRPFDFLVKPINFTKLEEVVLKAILISGVKIGYFEFVINKKAYKYSLNSILYFESKGRKIKIVTVDGKKEFYGKIKNVYYELKEKNFYLIHNSYLINYSKVKEQRYESVKLICGEEIPISRNNRVIMKEVLMNHMKGSI